jgi:CRISPR type III-A-associated protein Csm2
MRDAVRRSTIDELIEEIKREPKGLGKLDLAKLLKPEGYAEKVVKEAGLTRVQLRKIFAEFKTIETYLKSNKEKAKYHSYKLYPIIQYQVNRKLINENFKRLMFAILDSFDNEKDFEKNFSNTKEFLEALVAYTPREST